jgi:hypothetical protein
VSGQVFADAGGFGVAPSPAQMRRWGLELRLRRAAIPAIALGLALMVASVELGAVALGLAGYVVAIAGAVAVGSGWQRPARRLLPLLGSPAARVVMSFWVLNLFARLLSPA